MITPRRVGVLVACLGLAGAGTASANDTSIAFEAGAPVVVPQPEIHMVSEALAFRWAEPHWVEPDADGACATGYDPINGQCWIPGAWNADLEYVFENVGASTTIDIGLPFRMPPADADYDYSGPNALHPIENMQTFVDGSQAQVTQIDVPLRADDWLAERTYVVTVAFEQGQRRTLRHTYQTWAAGNSSGENWFSYLLLSGRSWAGPIGSVDITFELPDRTPCALVNLPHTFDGRTVRVALADWLPDRDFEVVWARPEFAWRIEDTAAHPATVDDALCESLAEGYDPAVLARELELYYGAPQRPDDAPLLDGVPLGCGAMSATWAGASHPDRDENWPPLWQLGAAHQLRYVEDPAWPAALPRVVGACVERWRGEGGE